MTGLDHHYTYRAYLLRCWAEPTSAGKGRIWRFSLESTREAGAHGFSSLEELLAFIRSAIGETDEVDESME
jgi:hypothetical protein